MLKQAHSNTTRHNGTVCQMLASIAESGQRRLIPRWYSVEVMKKHNHRFLFRGVSQRCADDLVQPEQKSGLLQQSVV